MGALSRGWDPGEAARVAARGASVLAKALENPKETNFYRLSSLGNALAALAPRINPEEAASLGNVLVEALENPQETNPDRLSGLGSALAALAVRMNPEEAAGWPHAVPRFWPKR